MSKKKGDTIFWGIFIVLVGIIFLLKNLGLTGINIWDIATTYWPLILIYIGVKNIVLYVTQKK